MYSNVAPFSVIVQITTYSLKPLRFLFCFVVFVSYYDCHKRFVDGMESSGFYARRETFRQYRRGRTVRLRPHRKHLGNIAPNHAAVYAIIVSKITRIRDGGPLTFVRLIRSISVCITFVHDTIKFDNSITSSFFKLLNSILTYRASSSGISSLHVGPIASLCPRQLTISGAFFGRKFQKERKTNGTAGQRWTTAAATRFPKRLFWPLRRYVCRYKSPLTISSW